MGLPVKQRALNIQDVVFENITMISEINMKFKNKETTNKSATTECQSSKEKNAVDPNTGALDKLGENNVTIENAVKNVEGDIEESKVAVDNGPLPEVANFMRFVHNAAPLQLETILEKYWILNKLYQPVKPINDMPRKCEKSGTTKKGEKKNKGHNHISKKSGKSDKRKTSLTKKHENKENTLAAPAGTSGAALSGGFAIRVKEMIKINDKKKLAMKQAKKKI